MSLLLISVKELKGDSNLEGYKYSAYENNSEDEEMADAADEYTGDDDDEGDEQHLMEHSSNAATSHVQGLGAGDDVAFLLDEEFPPSNLASLDEDVMVMSNNNSMDDLTSIRGGAAMVLQNPAMAALSPTPIIQLEEAGANTKKRIEAVGSSLRGGDSGMDDGESSTPGLAGSVTAAASSSSLPPTSTPISAGVTTRSQKNSILNLLNRNRKAAGVSTADSSSSAASATSSPPQAQPTPSGLSTASSRSGGIGSAIGSAATTRLPAVQKVNTITRSNSSLNLISGDSVSPSIVDSDLVDKLVRLHRQSINAFDEASRIEKNLLVGFATSGIGSVGGCSIGGGSSSSSTTDLEVYLRELDAVMEKKQNRITEVRSVIQKILESGGEKL